MEYFTPPISGFPPEVWGNTHPDARVARIKQRLLTAERWVDVERARYTARSYQRTEGQPMPIRRATMLLDVVRELSIAICDDELIVGNRSALPRSGVIAPEGAVEWVDRELEILPARPQDRFNIGSEQIQELREEIFPYWRGKTLEDTVAARVPGEVARAVRGKAFSLNQTDHAQGHILPDVEGWLRVGIGGLRAQVEAARHRPGLTGEQHVFYEAALIALQAASEFVARYAALAERMAGDPARSDGFSRPTAGGAAEAATTNSTTNPTTNPTTNLITIEARREELLGIAERCWWLAQHPARNFPEALQAVWFLFVLLQIESNASSFSPGRLDQYLLPYLEADLTAGSLDLMAAQGWLELLWLKFNEIVLLRSSASARYFAGFPIGFNVIVGGQLPAVSDHPPACPDAVTGAASGQPSAISHQPSAISHRLSAISHQPSAICHLPSAAWMPPMSSRTCVCERRRTWG